jgi:hypothetical protein
MNMPTYVIGCDTPDCLSSFAPPVGHEIREELAERTVWPTVPRRVADVRALAVKEGWRFTFRENRRGGPGWYEARCPRCAAEDLESADA